MGKKILILSLVAVISFSGYAQKKPKANKALNYLKKGELAMAKDEIDRAVKDEKQGADAKTWYYRGLIYCALDTTSNAEIQALSDNAVVVAAESFEKADELNTGKELYISDESGFPILKSQQIDYFWGQFLNEGAGYYNEQEYESALEYFEKSIALKPNDTTAYLYAGTVAAMADMRGEALTYFYKTKELGMKDREVYGSIINLERSYNKDTAAALAVVREAIDTFEDNDSFKKEEINILIMTNQVDDAKQKIQENIDSDPDNETLYYSLGFLLDQTGTNAGKKADALNGQLVSARQNGDDEKIATLEKQIAELEAEEASSKAAAVEAYKKALEIKPDYFEANFNTGVYYYNEAIAKQNEINNLGISKEDQAKRKELQPLVPQYFKNARPYFEAAIATNPDDVSILETLELIYMQIGEDEKAKEITSRLEALGAGN